MKRNLAWHTDLYSVISSKILLTFQQTPTDLAASSLVTPTMFRGNPDHVPGNPNHVPWLLRRTCPVTWLELSCNSVGVTRQLGWTFQATWLGLRLHMVEGTIEHARVFH